MAVRQTLRAVTRPDQAHRVAVRLLRGHCPVSERYIDEMGNARPGFDRLGYVVYCLMAGCYRFVCPACGTRALKDNGKPETTGPSGKKWYYCWEHAPR